MPPAAPTPLAAARARVFGLDVTSDRPLALLDGAPRAGARRPLRVSFQPLRPARSTRARMICERRSPAGEQVFRIVADDGGYEVWGRDHGSFALSGDGRRLRCGALGPPARRERFLAGQVLPFAALLAGLEVFHASAVDWRGAVAFLGASGAGKTSLALAMCDRGASFLADDVLALEPRGARLFGHPGAPVAAVVRDRANGRRQAERDRGRGAPSPDPSEELVRVPVAPGPAPLTAAFLLDRRPDGPPAARFDPLTDPRVLISSSFNLVLSTPGRLLRLLEVCALASRARVERIEAGASLSPEEIADAVIERLGSAP